MIISSVLITGCTDSDNDVIETKPRLVQTQIINMNATNNYLEFPGEVSASQSSNLGFRISGKLAKLNALEGQEVEEGDVLAVLDDTDYAIQLQSRQADFDQANSQFKRGQQLLERKLLAQAEFEKLKAQSLSAQANLDAAKQNMNYTKLKAPFAGVISKKHVDNFEDINIMQPVYTLQDLSRLNIKVALPETVMIQSREDEKARVRALFDSLPGQEFPLEVTSVSTEADPGTKTFEVTLSMDRVEGVNILPGMSVSVRGTPPGAEEQVNIIVPTHAVIADGLGKAVYIVEQLENNQGVIARRPVETGALSDQGIVILSGLIEGDRVVTAGMSLVSEGLVVRVNEDWTE